MSVVRWFWWTASCLVSRRCWLAPGAGRGRSCLPVGTTGRCRCLDLLLRLLLRLLLLSPPSQVLPPPGRWWCLRCRGVWCHQRSRPPPSPLPTHTQRYTVTQVWDGIYLHDWSIGLLRLRKSGNNWFPTWNNINLKYLPCAWWRPCSAAWPSAGGSNGGCVWVGRAEQGCCCQWMSRQHSRAAGTPPPTPQQVSVAGQERRWWGSGPWKTPWWRKQRSLERKKLQKHCEFVSEISQITISIQIIANMN